MQCRTSLKENGGKCDFLDQSCCGAAMFILGFPPPLRVINNIVVCCVPETYKTCLLSPFVLCSLKMNYFFLYHFSKFKISERFDDFVPSRKEHPDLYNNGR